MPHIVAVIKTAKVAVALTKVRQIYRREGFRGLARRVPWWLWALLAAAAAAMVTIFTVIMMIMMTMATAASSVTNIVDRLPGATWIQENIFRQNDDIDIEGTSMTQEEAQELKEALDSEGEIKQCLAEAPPVTSRAETLFIATEEEKRAVAEYQDSRNGNREGRDGSQGPRNVDAKRGAVSASAEVNVDLISTQPAVVPSGEQIMDGDQVTNKVNDLINEIPPGTDVGTAQTFLLVAYSGGVVNWQHFTAILDASDIEMIPSQSTLDIAAQFFEPGIDFSPYYTAVNASLISLSVDGTVTGSVKTAANSFGHCGSSSGEGGGQDRPSETGSPSGGN